MKKIYLSTLLTLFVLNIFGQTAPTNGLVAYYPFNGNPYDVVGTKNGIVNGAVLTIDRFGNQNSAYSFDGINDNISLNHQFASFQEITVSAWILENQTTNDHQAILSPSDQSFVHLQLNNAGNNVIYANNSVLLPIILQSPLAIWRHILIKSKSGESKIYENGVQVGSSSTTYTQINGTNLLFIGSGFQNGRFFNGKIDDIRIYNRALTDTEVQQLYQAEAPPIDITTGLVAQYKLDGDAQDASGNGNNITQQGGVTYVTDRFGNAGKAANFDGVDDRIIVQNSNSLNLTTMSVSAWVRPKGWYNGPCNANYILTKGWDNQQNYGLSLNGGNLTTCTNRINSATYSGRANGNWRILSSNNNTINLDIWNNITATYNGNVFKLFINGVLQGTFNHQGTLDLNSQNLFIGSNTNLNSDFQYFFNGILDDIRIYNRALTDTEVQALYQAEAPPIDITTGLVAHYKMDGNAQDASGNNNHGTAQNGATFDVDRFGNAGKSAKFDGVNDFVQATSSQTLTTMTTSFWFKPSNLNIQTPLCIGVDNGVGGSPTLNGISLFVPSNVVKILSSDQQQIPTGYTFPSANQWYFVSIQQNAGQYKMFVDSSIVFIGNGAIPRPATQIRIGSATNVRFFDGLMDDIRIYSRALSDADVKAIYNLEKNISLTNVKIEPLLENINQTNYTKIPREATVHHYFLAKDNTTGAKLKDVTVVYQYGPFLHQSVPTDTSGLIDLNIMVGGLNPNSSDDDWSPVGTQTVTFHSLLVGNVTGTNAFTPFDITVIDKAEPIDEEMGIGLGFSVGNEAFKAKDSNKVPINGVTFGLKTAVGLKLGATADAYIKIKPTGTPKSWKVFFNAGIGSNIGGEVKYGLGFGNGGGAKDYSVGLVGSTAFEVNDAVRLESGYLVNLNNKQELYRLAELIFLTNSNYAPAKELATIFGKLADKASPALTNISYGGSLAYGGGFNVAASTKGIFKIRTLDLDKTAYGQIPAPGLSAQFNAKGDFNDNMIYDYQANGNQSITNTIDVGLQAKADFNSLVEITKGNRIDNPILSSQPFKILDFDLEKNISVKKEFDTNYNPINAEVSFSTKTNEFDIGGKMYNKIFTNRYKYGSSVFLNLFPIMKSQDANKLKLNTISGFLTDENNSLIIGSVINQGLAGTFYEQADSLNKFMQRTVKQFNLPSSDIGYISDQEITLINRQTKTFGLPRFKSASFAINLDSWKTYKHNLVAGVYNKQLNRVLLTVDYPEEIYSNLEIPDIDPLTELKDYIEAAIQNEVQGWIDDAQAFINKLTKIVDQQLDIVFTNWNLPRFSTNGTLLYDPKLNLGKNSTLTQNAPSVFTFTIPKLSFNNGVNLDFKFYFPDNEITAITPTDTFRIISDIFTLSAQDNGIELTASQNGTFNIETTFSQYDLELASLPSNLVPVVLFQPHGSNTWIQIGAINSVIPYSQLGIFGIGIKISNDNISPTISVVNPVSFTAPNFIEVNFSDSQTGIDWAKSNCLVNSKLMPINRIGTSNVFRIYISDIPVLPNGIIYFNANTVDLAGNTASYTNVFPCDESLLITSLSDDPNNPILKKALKIIKSNGQMPTNKSVIFYSEKAIELTPGFETKESTFKAEIKGCLN